MTDSTPASAAKEPRSKRLYRAGRWRFGSYNIGSTKVLMIGPFRWFCRG